jgi:hypothetical protein
MPTVVAHAGTATGGPGREIHVYVRVTHDHRALALADLRAWQAVEASINGHFVVVGIGQQQQMTPPQIVEACRVAGANNDITVKQRCATRDAFYAGQLPFATFINAIDGKKWGKYWNRAGAVMTVMPVPPAPGGWGILGDLWDFGAAIIAESWDAIRWAANHFCSLINNPDVQIANAAATGMLTSAGAYGWVAASNPWVATALATGAAIALAGKLCSAAGLGTDPVAHVDVPPTPPPGSSHSVVVYPTAAVTAFDPKTRTWRVAAPAGAKVSTVLRGLSGPFDDVRAALGARQVELPSSPDAPTRADGSAVPKVTFSHLEGLLGIAPWWRSARVLVPVGAVVALAAAGTAVVFHRRNS